MSKHTRYGTRPAYFNVPVIKVACVLYTVPIPLIILDSTIIYSLAKHAMLHMIVLLSKFHDLTSGAPPVFLFSPLIFGIMYKHLGEDFLGHGLSYKTLAR